MNVDMIHYVIFRIYWKVKTPLVKALNVVDYLVEINDPELKTLRVRTFSLYALADWSD